MGEGGGQILRSSLAMSALTGAPIRIEKIRAGRKKPGLLRQHLTAVQAAQAICEAKVEGAELKAQTIEFAPGPVRGGEYEFKIGSAGSVMLVLQTILPPLLFADGPSTVALEGGTHNPMSPPFDFLLHTFLPTLAKMGAQVELRLHRPGFYPAGGGRAVMKITPVQRLSRLELMEGGPAELHGHVLLAHLPQHVCERELAALKEGLSLSDEALSHDLNRTSKGPGNVVMVRAKRPQLTELFTVFGERGVRAETLVERLIEEVKTFIGADVAVGEHLADQLLIPMALGQGGRFTTVPLSLHTKTNMEVLKLFCEVDFAVEPLEGRGAQITVTPGASNPADPADPADGSAD